MIEPVAIIVPLINPNEPASNLVALYVKNGQNVHKGDRLCTLETTKATQELIAERDGYVVGLSAVQGQTLQAGEVLGYLADTAIWLPPANPPQESMSPPTQAQAVRTSQAARQLADTHQVDLSQFSSEVFVTEKMVQEVIDRSIQPGVELLLEQYAPNQMIIYGGGGHGKSLVDLVHVLGTYTVVGIVDDGLPSGTSVMGVKVLGGASILGELRQRGLQLAANAVGGIGNIASRITVFERLVQAGFTCPLLVHPAAFVEPSASLAQGVQVLPHAYVGSEAQVGFGVIVNTGAIVSHDCILGKYANLSPGAILAGEVSVGDATLIGMGVTVNLRVKIGPQVRIGNGATVKQDVPGSSIVRAGTLWPV
jgi:acetyltransferase EpsM